MTTSGLLLTADGGATWRNATPPGVRWDRIRAVRYLPPDQLWVVWLPSVSPQRIAVSQSSNAGRAWREELLPGSYPDRIEALWLDPLDADHVWLSVARERADIPAPGILYRTSDGGANWKELGFPIGGPVSFSAPLHGWVAGSECTPCGPGLVVGSTELERLLSTNDGGTSWHERIVPLPPQNQLDGVDYWPPTLFGSDQGVLPVGLPQPWPSVLAYSHAAFAFFTTSDGGTGPGGSDWILAPSPPPGGYGTPFAFGPKRWLLFQTSGVAVATDDGGTTWTVRAARGVPPSTPSVASRLWFPSFATPMDGWAVVGVGEGGQVGLGRGHDGVLFATHDGGDSWEPVTLPAPRRSSQCGECLPFALTVWRRAVPRSRASCRMDKEPKSRRASPLDALDSQNPPFLLPAQGRIDTRRTSVDRPAPREGVSGSLCALLSASARR